MTPNDPLKKIKMLLLDVDGVLTDGAIVYDDRGVEIKSFHVRDGLGIRLLIGAGIRVGIVTGRRSEALLHRCRNLGIALVLDGIRDKAAALDQIVLQEHILPENIGFMGDDLPDLPIMRRVGTAVAVSDAHPMVRAAADIITEQPGGKGAVREVAEGILMAQHLWEKALERF